MEAGRKKQYPKPPDSHILERRKRRPQVRAFHQRTTAAIQNHLGIFRQCRPRLSSNRQCLAPSNPGRNTERREHDRRCRACARQHKSPAHVDPSLAVTLQRIVPPARSVAESTDQRARHWQCAARKRSTPTRRTVAGREKERKISCEVFQRASYRLGRRSARRPRRAINAWFRCAGASISRQWRAGFPEYSCSFPTS